MKVILFGATGMIGQSVLRECLADPQVTSVLSIGRTPVDATDPKLEQVTRTDLFRYDDIASRLTGFDACFFCLGTPSSGKTEDEYTRVTYDLTMAAAETLSRLHPQMTFIYVSGDGADSTEKGRVMWARVRGKTENALLKMPFRAVYIFRPAVIEPMHGIRSKTRAYQMFYDLTKPVLPLFRRLFPNAISTTDQLSRAMLNVARTGAPKKILTTKDFAGLAAGAGSAG